MKPPNREAPIGLFDSGLGGLTVAAAIARALPHEDLVYFGDTARVPYGNRSPGTVVRYARNIMGFLRRQDIKLAVVACNTVSAHALDALVAEHDIPVLGVIAPGARAAHAASRNGRIAVLATPGTVRSEAYPQALTGLDEALRAHQVACPLFVPLVEEGWLDHPVAEMVAREYLSPLVGTGVDTVILGCTHYPLLRPVLRRVVDALLGPHVAIVDSAEATAVEALAICRRLEIERARPGGARRFYVTDAPERSGEVAARFWGAATATSLELEHVDLQDGPR